jgi:malonyl CoA-acyl carrier protein transacylase
VSGTGSACARTRGATALRRRPTGGPAWASGGPAGASGSPLALAPEPADREGWLAPPPVEAYVLHAADPATLAATASRIADLAPALSNAELHDLACQLGRLAGPAGGHRLGIVASGQRQLASLAAEAVRLLPTVRPGQLATRPGIFAGHAPRGRVVLLFPGLGTGQEPAGAPGGCPPPLFGLTDPEAVHPAVLHASLSGLRWLDRLGVRASAAIGHSLGEISALAWAGCLTEADATRLVAQRGAVIRASAIRQTAMVSLATDAATAKALCVGTGLVVAAFNGPASHVLAGPVGSVRDVLRRAERQGIPATVLDVSHAFHSPAMAGCVAPLRAVLGDITLAAPRRRVVSTVTGREILPGDDLARLLCAELTSPARFTEALAAVADEADLLCETGPGRALARLASAGCDVPAVSLEARTGDDHGPAQAAAALFAAGAVDSLEPMLAGRPARSVDLWQERITLLPAASEDQPERGTEESTAVPAQGSTTDQATASDRASGPATATATERQRGAAADVIPFTKRGPARPETYGRFLQHIRLHRPGAELVADSRLADGSDPYLADYRIDGHPVLPAVLGLEAMAQAASALTGRTMRRAARVSFDAPVRIPAGQELLIRVCAKREGKRVSAVLRSRVDGDWVDHARASFPMRAAGPAARQLAAPAGSGRPGGTNGGHGHTRPAGAARMTAAGAGRAAASQGGGTATGQGGGTGAPDWRVFGRTTGILDSADLYGSICFQTGRFRRVAFLPELTSRRCRALVRGGDDQPWFGAGIGQADAPLVLGSPGLNDATLHVLQACFPQRRVLPAGCAAVTFTGRPVSGAVEVRAWQRASRSAPSGRTVKETAGGGPHAADEYLWDVTAVDAAGQPVISWSGLRLRDAGPVPGNTPLPPALLGVYLERGATALGLDPALRIAVRCEQPEIGPAAAGAWPAASTPARRPGWVSARSRGQLDELSLRLRGASPAACAWETADMDAGGPPPPEDAEDAEFEALRQRLRDSLAEPTPTVRARIRTAIECLSKAGRPVGCELVVDGCYDNGWALMHAGDALIACTSVWVIGISCPVAVSIMTGTGMHAAGAA